MYPYTSRASDIFVIPTADKFLLYSPLHNFAALVNRIAVLQLKDALSASEMVSTGPLEQIMAILKSKAKAVPSRKQGCLAPEFLGLIPTRSCNLACVYCGFWDSDETGAKMDLKLARATVDWYLDLVCQTNKQRAAIHFFGGEPFSAKEVIDFTVYYAKAQAKEIGIPLSFEVATNGAFSQSRCQWVADYFDTVILSLDGPADIHNHHRPYRGGQGSFDVVARNAKILSKGATELSLRACITNDTVDRMEEMANQFCQTFHPQLVCFETLQPTAQSEAAGLYPPDPWQFAHNFIKAASVLESYGVELVYATSDIRTKHISFCPVAKDVLIVSPDGMIAACYLLRRDWEAKGLNLRMGRIEADGTVCLDIDAVEGIRDMNVLNHPACECCFCRWHCAGGCHVNHRLSGSPGAYDDLCIQTRIITLYNIFKTMGQENEWNLLENSTDLQVAIWQPSDRLLDFGENRG